MCMWVGLVLIAGIDAELLISDGPEPVLLYNPDTYIIFLGAVVVCFEGIGLVLPLRDSMEPHMQVRQCGSSPLILNPRLQNLPNCVAFLSSLAAWCACSWPPLASFTCLLAYAALLSWC